MKIYEMQYRGGDPAAFVHDGEDTSALDPRLDIRNHSPDGFAWGYAGLGPAQLALALCVDATGDVERSEKIYQDFKFFVIAAKGQHEDWKITQDDLMVIIAQIESNRNIRAND